MKALGLSGLSPLISALLIVTPIMIAGGQILFKKTSERLLTRGDAGFLSIAFDPIFITALSLYGTATLLWIYVLKVVPLSYAYSFMALTFVIVPLLSLMFLGESISWRYGVGSALIIAGLIIAQG